MKQFALRAALFACSLLALGTPAAQGQNAANGYVEPATLSDLVAAAAKEGTLTLAAGDVYGSAAGARLIQDHLNAKYHTHITINYESVPGGQAFQIQLAQEVRAGQTASSDVAFTLFSGEIAAAMQRIDWRKYDPDVPESDMFYDKRAVGVYTTLGAFDYNTNLVPRNKVPQSFNDLLKPEWKGKIATTPAEGNFLAFLGLPEVFGHQGMLDFVQKFSEQVGGIMPCGQIDRVTDGEFPIFGLDCGDFNVRKLQRLQRPIGAAFPKEGVPLTYIAPAIPITAAHPNSARLFIAYLLTREGQNDLWNISASDDDQLPGSHIAAEVNDLKRHGVKIINVYGLEIKHPELLNYAKEIDRIIHQGK